MNGWLLVFLFKMWCHKASFAVIRLVAFQGVQKEALYVTTNWWQFLTRLNQDQLFFFSLPFDFVVGILEYWFVS